MAFAALLGPAAVPVGADEGGESRALPPASEASEAPDAQRDVTVLDEVSVTAKGYASPVEETPHGVVVVGEDEIERADARTPGDLLRGRPGIAVQSDGAWGMNPVLRGLKKEQIVLMVDGVRIHSAQPQGAVASFVDLGALERVEVVKGPASVLHGSGAMGGVVHFVTRRRAFTAEPAATGRLAADAFSVNRGYRVTGSAAFTSPWVVLEATGSGLDFGDYLAPEGEVDRSGYEEWSGTGRLRLRLADRHRLSFQFQKHRSDDVWYPGSTRPNPAPFVGDATIHSPRQERTLFQGEYEWALGGPGDWTFRLAGWRQTVERQIRAFSEALRKDFVRAEVDFETLGGGASVDGYLFDVHHLSAGADLWRTRADPERTIDIPPFLSNPIPNPPFRDGQLRSVGLYLQDEILLDDWTITLGARVDQVRGGASRVGTGVTARTEGLRHQDETISWSAGVVYHYSAALSPYASVAEGYRAADLRERFEESARGDGFIHRGDPDLDPERNLSVEAGVRGALRWAWGETRYTISGSYATIRDYIAGRVTGEIDRLTGLPVKRTENLAKVEIWSAELEVEHDFGRDLAAFLAASWQRGRNRFDHEPLFEMPPPEMTLGAAWRPERGWNAEARLRLVAAQDRVATRFSNGTEDSTAGFATVDARVGYRFASWAEAHLGVTNLFDKRYHEHLTEGVAGREPDAPRIGVYVGAAVEF